MEIPSKGTVRLKIMIVCWSLLFASCSTLSGPDIPSNAAVWFVEGALAGDSSQVRSRTCAELIEEADLDLANPATFGRVTEFMNVLIGDSERRVGWFGGEAEYSDNEQLRLESDEAWTEMGLWSGGEPIGTWRLHMVRQDGSWKVCDAEPRPD